MGVLRASPDQPLPAYLALDEKAVPGVCRPAAVGMASPPRQVIRTRRAKSGTAGPKAARLPDTQLVTSNVGSLPDGVGECAGELEPGAARHPVPARSGTGRPGIPATRHAVASEPGRAGATCHC